MADYQSFPLVGEYNVQRSLQNDSQDTINMYIVKGQGMPDSFAPFPGVDLIKTIQSGSNPMRDNGVFVPLPISGSNALQSNYFVIVGNAVYRIDSAGVQYFLGNINSFSGTIFWSNNTTQIIFVDGVNYWYHTVGGPDTISMVDFSAISGFPTNPTPQMIYYQDARIFITFVDSNQVFYSAQGNGASWDSNNFFPMQSRPDFTVGICGINERVFIFGTKSTEVWQPTTYNSDLPLLRDNNFLFEYGCLARGSIVKGVLDIEQGKPVISFIFFLSSHEEGVGSFMISDGGVPIKISTEAIDLVLRSLTNPADCVSTVYKEAGHVFIENTFTADNVTFVFDLVTRKWSRKVYFGDNRSIINSHIFWQGIHIVGSRLGPYLYQLSDKYLTDNGAIILHSRTTQTLYDPGGKLIRCNYFEVMLESGFINITAANPSGSDLDDTPIAYLSVSYDGGVTYGNSRQASIGKIGQYKWRTWWDSLGIDYNFTFKIEVYSPVRVYMFGACIQQELLMK